MATNQPPSLQQYLRQSSAKRRGTNQFVKETLFERIKYHVWVLLEFPLDSRAGQAMARFFRLLVILSMFVECILSLNIQVIKITLETFEGFVMCMLAAETSARLLVAPQLLRFFKDPLNIADIFSSVPFFIELGLHGSFYSSGPTRGHSSLAFLRALRLVRLLRVLRLGRYNPSLRVFFRTMRHSMSEILLVSALLLLISLVCGAIMYECEKHAKSGFDSIPEAIWWAVVTVTTIGYGDLVPVTTLGKVVACFAMIIGSIILSLPITIMGVICTREYDDHLARNRGLKILAASSQPLSVRGDLLDLAPKRNSKSLSSSKSTPTLPRRSDDRLFDQKGWGRAFGWVMCGVTVIYTAALVALPERSSSKALLAILSICVTLILVDLTIGFALSPKFRFFISWKTIVDILAILPFFLWFRWPTTHPDLRVLGIIRITRLGQLAPLVGHPSLNEAVTLFWKSMAESMPAVWMLLSCVSVTLFVFGAVEYELERGTWNESLQAFVNENGKPTVFQSIPMAFWWAIQTITTVGYGGAVPVTAGGRIVAAIAGVLGTVGISLPVTILGAKFSNAFDKRLQSDIMRDMHPQTSSAVTTAITAEAQRLDDFHMDLMAFRELVKRKYPDLLVQTESLDVLINHSALEVLIRTALDAPRASDRSIDPLDL